MGDSESRGIGLYKKITLNYGIGHRPIEKDNFKLLIKMALSTVNIN